MPFKSESQRRFFEANKAKLEKQGGNVAFYKGCPCGSFRPIERIMSEAQEWEWQIGA